MIERLASALHSVGALDLAGALLLLLCVILGFHHGLIGQAARLLAIVLGFVLARAGAPHLAPVLAAIAPGLSPGFSTGAAQALLFLLALLAVALAALLLQKAVGILHLTFLDRLGGAAMGVATGLLLHFTLLLGVVLFVREERVSLLAQKSRSLRAAIAIVEQVRVALPPDALRAVLRAEAGLSRE